MSVRRVIPLLLTLSVVAALTAVTVQLGGQVTSTARSLQLRDVANLTTNMATYVSDALDQSEPGMHRWEAPARGWTLTVKDQPVLRGLTTQLPPGSALALLDTSGRVLVSDGNGALLPIGGPSDYATMISGALNGSLGLSGLLRTAGGEWVVGQAVRSQFRPGVIFTLFSTPESTAVSTYLAQFAEGAHGNFLLVDGDGRIAWASGGTTAGTALISEVRDAVPTSGGPRQISLAGKKTIVFGAPLGGSGWRLIYVSPTSEVMAGIEGKSRQLSLAVVAMLVILLCALALAAFRQARADGLTAVRLRTLMSDVSDAVLVLSDDGIVRYASPAVEDVLGVDERAAVGYALSDLVGSEASTVLLGSMAAARGSSRPLRHGDLECVTRTGRRLWVEVTLADRGRTAGVAGTVVSLHDVTERHVQSEKLSHDALHDSLTGLANRARFTNALTEALHRASRTGETVAVLYLDLDGFKPINDRLGHAAGDLVLQEVARRLAVVCRAYDPVARWGGDEFAILLEPANSEAAVAAASRILDELRPSMDVEGETVEVGASIGIAFGRSGSPEALMRSADLAMYEAKATAGSGWSVARAPLPVQRPPLDAAATL